jgi:hypothetical protein
MEKPKPLVRAYYACDPVTHRYIFVGGSALSDLVGLVVRQFSVNLRARNVYEAGFKKEKGALDLGEAMVTARKSGATQAEVDAAYNLGRRLGQELQGGYLSIDPSIE